MRARKAVIPAAGLGTRFLPATKAIPKEMLPIVDKPAIQYVVEEAVAAGLTDVLLVTAAGKGALEDHFDRSGELERQLAEAGKDDLLRIVRDVADLVRVHTVRQGEPLGLGHAVGCAREFVGDEPFAVLLPDDIIGTQETLLSDMLHLCESSGRTVLAAMPFEGEEITRYGVIASQADPDHPGAERVFDLVEKPAVADAPSNQGVIGRYVLMPDVFDAIFSTRPGSGGEIQLTDALRSQAEQEPIFAVRFSGVRYDVGNKSDYLRATVELAAARDDLGADFLAFLDRFLRSHTGIAR